MPLRESLKNNFKQARAVPPTVVGDGRILMMSLSFMISISSGSGLTKDAPLRFKNVTVTKSSFLSSAVTWPTNIAELLLLVYLTTTYAPFFNSKGSSSGSTSSDSDSKGTGSSSSSELSESEICFFCNLLFLSCFSALCFAASSMPSLIGVSVSVRALPRFLLVLALRGGAVGNGRISSGVTADGRL